MRAFLAIKISTNREIEEFYNVVQASRGSFKPVSLDQLHLTLKFFGEVDEEKAGEIKKLVRASSKDFEPFRFRLHGCGAFPNENYLKVLWIGMKDEETLVKLGTRLQVAFWDIGFSQDKFSPHLTLFRVKSPKNKEAIQKTMARYRDTNFGEVEVEEILLMKSQLTPQGPIHTVVERFSL